MQNLLLIHHQQLILLLQIMIQKLKIKKIGKKIKLLLQNQQIKKKYFQKQKN